MDREVERGVFSLKQQSFIKPYLYMLCAVCILMMSWEYNTSHASMTEGRIPEESIRLRILANSDGFHDQWIKIKIRDEIILHMNEWVRDAETLEAVRDEVQRRLPDFEQIVASTLQKYGFTYTYSVELNQVTFPTVMYGIHLYPAGDYEALRITLGRGVGENWWCVLFPPLCFVDIVSAKVEPNEETAPIEQTVLNPETDKISKKIQTNFKDVEDIALSEEVPEIRFFLWEITQKMTGKVKGWFHSLT